MNAGNPAPGPGETAELVGLVQRGESEALGRRLDRYRDRLLRVIRFRIDSRLTGRIDPEDVLQETFVEAMQRVPEYLSQPEVPFLVWLRFLTIQKVLQLHRHHLETQGRAAGRELRLGHGPLPGATSADLAARLLGNLTSPSQAAVRAEQRLKLEQALNQMDEIDREVLTLRHFEQLSNVETANVLGLSSTAASNRYIRAVRRLREILAPDGAANG
jgi:RNA polymerase sigma-70 factor, ECF subfamily